ncbi:MAG TPA: SusC/RagA family TonB-linked outer membrane protein [Puia sp.]|nr:SusC/RagA family TonB-linked outer membrane protein [Puia sp.]
MRHFTTMGVMRIFLGVILSTLLFYVPLRAQNTGPRTITGTVTSGASGAVIAGASITVKGTRNGTSAGNSGEFSIRAQGGDILIISYIGYKSREIKIGAAATTVYAVLTEDLAKMDDVIVVGYGKMKKTNLSSAVVTISNADLNKTVNVTLDDALQGKSPNVYVSTSSGAPGSGAAVIIRGVSTVTGNYQPLYVVDGVQIRPGMATGGAYNSTPTLTNELAGINPEDIETISVLEGPAATSIYGAAGANGVLMITTKSGKAGATRVNANESQTLQERPKNLPVMNLREYAVYIGKLQHYGLVGVEPPELGDPTILGSGTDWQHALFQQTRLQKHSLALSGGTDKSTFYFSGDYLNQSGVAIGSGFQRGSIRLNLTNQATKWMKFSTNFSAFTTKEKANTFQNNIINLAVGQNPTIPVKNPDGTFGGPANLQQAQYATTNPIAIANLNNNYNTSFGVIGGVNLDITPLKGLLWHTEVNGNYTFTNNYQFNPHYTLGAYYSSAPTSGSRGSGNNYWASVNTRLQYTYTHDKHSATIMAGHEATYYAYQTLNATGLRYSTNSIQELSVADPLSPPGTSSRGDGAGESYFGRLNYTYDNKYIVEGVVRRDGSSNFGPANRWGTFPAVSIAWKLSDENFMKGIGFINDLKIRAEYGISGNSGSGGAVYSNLYSTATIWGSGFLPSNFPNPDLKWEQDQATNVGLDAHLFNNRVEFIADAYYKKISNLILEASGPSYLGGYLSGGYGGQVQWPVENYGGMQNKGIGLTLNTVNIATHDFQWRTGINFSIDRNKVTKLVSSIYTQYYSQVNDRQAEFATQVGQPISMILGYQAQGLFQNYKDVAGHAIQTGTSDNKAPMIIDATRGSWVGDIKYKDVNGDGYVDTKDLGPIGNPWPKYTYNFTSTFTYKEFELNLFFTGVYGNQILNLTRYQNETLPQGTGPYNNHFKNDINFAVPSSILPADALTAVLTNPGHNIPNVFVDANGNNRISNWNVEDGSYLKLKNVRLSYRVPTKYLSQTHVLRGALATFQVQNAFVITHYTGYDPEVGIYNYGGVNLVGVDEGRYPSTRSYTFSLSLDF